MRLGSHFGSEEQTIAGIEAEVDRGLSGALGGADVMRHDEVIAHHQSSSDCLRALTVVDVFPVEEVVRIKSTSRLPYLLADCQARTSEPTERRVHFSFPRCPHAPGLDVQLASGKPDAAGGVQDSGLTTSIGCELTSAPRARMSSTVI